MRPGGLEATSTEIRRVALQMFATQGYDATSIRDIASAVGIRGASMYHHFAAKEELLWQLTDAALHRLAESWGQVKSQLHTTDPVIRLRAFVRCDVVWHAEHRTEAVLVNSQLDRLSPEHHARAREMRRGYELELTAIVTDCLATGNHSAPDVRVTVYAILQMIMAIAQWYDPDGPLSIDQIVDVYAELALKMLAPV